ncbi:MAG: serine/threonine protein kinase [Hydrogenophaga sp.]|uniref:serine/threonine protein kinase n=1 Tax=Hydrogenophaga sp. TaxID=1904254 RepID=UPI001DBEC9F4|nr:serine/threonine protein kinase [Hydrogenophaga sp.]MBX3609338.1 serine/threonine protein kinase [Hydrogenophaga sp.]
MSTETPHPFDALTPDVVLDALDAAGLYGDGRLITLNSYENRVYQIPLETPYEGHDVVVAKFYRPQRWHRAQIEEEHVFAAELAAAEVPAVAPLCPQGRSLHEHRGFLWSASPRRGGRRPELDDVEVLEWIGRFLARLHTVGEARPFEHRHRLDVQRYAREPLQWLNDHDTVPIEVAREWREISAEAVACVEQHGVLSGVPTPEGPACIRLHGDCHPGNILWTPEGMPGAGPHFVDLDDACMGPAVQDLWMLLSGDRAQQIRQLGALVDGYEQFRPFDRRELALIEPLRTLRLIHYNAWIARRWDDPSFPPSFPWFAHPDHWRGQIRLLREQIDAMQLPPLVA